MTQAKAANISYFYIKLSKNSELDDDKGKTREFNSTIKLKYPIRGAKFLKISNIFVKDTILLVNCDLVDENFLYTNIIDSNNYDDSNIFNTQIVFIGFGEQYSDLIKIDKSKSLINEFTISVKNLNKKPFHSLDIENAFIKIKIYHE